MENAAEAETPVEIKLPRFLDISVKACAAEHAGVKTVGEWAAFGDNEGRMITQRIDLVFNASDQVSNDDRKEESTPRKEQDFVLVVATEDFSSPSSELPKNILSGDHEESYQYTKTWVEKEEDGRESLLSHQYLDCELTQEGARQLMRNEEDFDGYPCLKSTWYIRRPANKDAVVDGITIVDTKALVEDLRSFLKQHSIPLQHYAKCYLNRKQSTLSDLMNYPKPWSDLSDKGREIYLKLMEFLSDENLPLLTASLRRKHSGAKGERLPDNILDPLSRGLMPSDKNISIAASCAKISISHLKMHCENQIKLYDLEEFVKSHPLVIQGSESEVHNPNSMKSRICAYSGCGLVLQDTPTFDIHMKSHFRSKPQKCDTCRRSFATKSYLNLHRKAHNGTAEICSKAKKRLMSEITKQEVYDDDDGSEEDLTSLKYICGMCWRGFISRQRLLKHMSSVHSVEEKYLGRGFMCYVCRKILKNHASLEVHMRTHTNKRPFECDQCEMKFQTKGNLQRHMRSHTGERPFACKHCPARFNEARSLATHQTVHTGEKPFECKICGKCFAQSHVLKNHSLIHEQKMPFSCDDCGRRFRQMANLYQHKRRHRGMKNHKCSMCEMSFLTKSDYIRHVQKHTGIKMHRCELCMKTFTRPVYLRDHQQRLERHTTPQCQRCNKKFCNDSLLKKHLATHEFLHKNEGFVRKDHNPCSNQRSDAFATLDSSENNVLFLATKTAFNNEKHYILAPMQSFEGAQASLQDHDAINNFQPVVLASDESRIPFSTTSGHSVILQGIDLPVSQVSDMLFTAELTTVRGINIPILSDEEDHIKSNREIMDCSDPNMQCTVAKSHDDSVILTQDIQEMPTKQMKLAEHDEACQVIIQNPASEGNLPVVIAMSENPHVSAPVCQPELVPQILSSTPTLGSGGREQDADSDNQTYIIVDLELES